MFSDLRYALRQLAKSPGFTTVAVLTLALGLTVNAAVFFFVSDFFLRPLPARNPEQLVIIAQKSPQFEMPFPFSYVDFQDFRRAAEGSDQTHSEMAQTFAGLMAYSEMPVHVSYAGDVTARTWVHMVSNNYFEVLGVRPLHGRLLLPTEGIQSGADPVIVLTHEAWRTRFAADLRIIGQSVKLNGKSFTVIGVTPRDFVGASWRTALEGFVPATMVQEINPARRSMLTGRGNTGFFMMGRLQPGAGIEQARAAADVLAARLLKDYPAEHAPQIKAVVMSESLSRPSPFVANYTPLIVTALGAMSLLVLAIAIANVANLLFARAADRERELAIRGALGASRSRLLRQLLVESVLLAIGAGIVGALASLWITPYLDAIGPGGEMAPGANAGTDWRLFLFTFGASLVTGLLTGLLPALKATRCELLPQLNEGTRSMAGARHPLRSLLVVGQVAVSCVVLVSTGLALRSLQKLTQVNLGFKPDHLLLASFDVGLQRYSTDQGRQFQKQLLEQVRALPGASAASLTEHVPFEIGGNMRSGIFAEGQDATEKSLSQFIPVMAVDHAYLSTAGTRIAQGRDFAARDEAASQRVAIINRVLARQLWPSGDPVGKRLMLDNRPIEIIGIIEDGRFWSITDKARPLLFLPLAQHYRSKLTLLVRTQGEPAQLGSAVERIVRHLDPDLPLYNVRSMEQQIASSPLGLMPLRVGSLIAGAQGLIALLLAALGIFGLVSFAVSRRTREIGVRMALGAHRSDVLLLVTRQSFKLTLIGLGCGLLLALGLTRALSGLLYGVSPLDAVVYAGVVLLVAGITLLACWLPARRATHIDPVEALRSE